jgi:hypothetical protein
MESYFQWKTLLGFLFVIGFWLKEFNETAFRLPILMWRKNYLKEDDLSMATDIK